MDKSAIRKLNKTIRISNKAFKEYGLTIENCGYYFADYDEEAVLNVVITPTEEKSLIFERVCINVVLSNSKEIVYAEEYAISSDIVDSYLCAIPFELETYYEDELIDWNKITDTLLILDTSKCRIKNLEQEKVEAKMKSLNHTNSIVSVDYKSLENNSLLLNSYNCCINKSYSDKYNISTTMDISTMAQGSNYNYTFLVALYNDQNVILDLCKEKYITITGDELNCFKIEHLVSGELINNLASIKISCKKQ